MAACGDPRNFQGQDLVKELQDKLRKYPVVGFNHPFQYNLAVLALCTAGATVSSDQMEGLSAVKNDSTHSAGTLSMGVVAAGCLYQKQYKQKHIGVRRRITKAVAHLKRIQETNGGEKFGSEISTANGVMVSICSVFYSFPLFPPMMLKSRRSGRRDLKKG